MFAEESTVLPNSFGGGPHGLGDPNDRTLRNVEKEVMIPKIMRENAKKIKCADLVKKFQDCCKETSLLLVVKCREENDAMKQCLTHWYQDEGFRNECTEEYLRKRNEFRATGIRQNMKRM